MTIKQKGTATVVEHGGKEYRLLLTNHAMLRLEERTKLGIAELMDRLGAMSLKAVVDLFWAAQLHADPGLKREAVVEMLDPTDLKALVTALGDETARYFGQGSTNGEPPTAEQEDEAENPPPATD